MTIFKTMHQIQTTHLITPPVKGIRESKPANEKLGWEKVTMSDIGLDADFWNGKLRATADYYIKKNQRHPAWV